uniref:Uncharacterized protein n=1 Tax=Candidatus Kentrum sp. TUN TaxID=2126343 RepID=A0A451A735_9GAMM|nr:MAG: hypothetical protein BECKTUN1418D_GA0071000_11615 [Candidatus Kentron sp. TUN]
MAYGTFKTVEEVATKFDIEVAEKTAFMGEKALEVPALLFDMIMESLGDNTNFINEVTICERIISPTLTVVSRYNKGLKIWSHVPYNIDEQAGLVGEPDCFVYFPLGFTNKSPFSRPVSTR